MLALLNSKYSSKSAIERSLNYAWLYSMDAYGLVSHTWLPDAPGLKKPKWILDEACIAELYIRLASLKRPSGKL